jgi:hypothetical protein
VSSSADDHGIDLIAEDSMSSEPLLGLGSPLHLDLEDDFGIDRVIDDDHGIVLVTTLDSMSSEPLFELGSRLSPFIDTCVINDNPGINLIPEASIPSQPLLGLDSRLSPSNDDRVMADDHGIDHIAEDSMSSEPLLGAGSRLLPSNDDRVMADDHGINLAATQDSLSSSPLLGLGSRLHLDLEDDFGYDLVIDGDHGIALVITQDSISSESPALGSCLHLDLEDDFGIDRVIDHDHGIDLVTTHDSISSEPPLGLGSRLSPSFAACVAIKDDPGIHLILSTLPGLSSRLLSTLSDDRVIPIKDNNGINLIPSQPPALGSSLSTWIEDRASKPPGLSSCLSISIGDPIIAIQDDHGINLIPSQPPALGSPLSAWIEDRANKTPGLSSRPSISIGDPIIVIHDNDGINLIPSQPPALGSRLSTSWIENSPIVLFSFHDDCGINNVNSADETPSELLGLGSHPSPSSGFEVDCRTHAVPDNAILKEPPRFGSDVSDVIIPNGAIFSTSCDSFATVPKSDFRRRSQLVHCPSVFHDQSLSDQGRMSVNPLFQSHIVSVLSGVLMTLRVMVVLS